MIITQDRLLEYIKSHPGCRPREIENSFSSTAGNIRGKISHLIDKGLIRQEFDKGSRRNYRLFDTACTGN